MHDAVLFSSGNRNRRPTSTPLRHPDNDLSFGSTLIEIRKRFLCLLEWKYPIYHRPNVPSLEKLTDLCELTTVRAHEQERVGDAVLFGAANNPAAQ
jgi:hypothetical protein